MSKIERFIELRDKATTSGVTSKEKEELARLGQVVTSEDEKALYELQQQRQKNVLQLRLTRIYQKVRNKHGQILKQCAANDELLKEYAGLPEDLLIEAILRGPDCFVWIDPPESKTDPKVLSKDRETLAQAAREYRTFGCSEANLALCRDVLSPGFSQYMLLQGIRSNALRLAPPTDEERQQWAEEDADREKLRLMNASTRELKAEMRDGYADRKRQAAQAEADRVFAEKEKHDQMVGGFPPLPDTFKGRRVDRDFFAKMRCTREELKFLTQKFGSANIEARIRGIR